MFESPAANAPVGVEDVTGNRDARVLRQRAMLARGEGVVVSFTVNMPGPVKDTDDARAIFRAGLEALTLRARSAGWQILDMAIIAPVTGPEALVRIAAQGLPEAPAAVKAAAVAIEESHPLGRLFDFDVLAPDGTPISRTGQGKLPRVCLVCTRPAAACARSRAHSVEDLLDRISRMVAEYKATSPGRGA